MDIINGMIYLHSKDPSIIHRDLKYDNIEGHPVTNVICDIISHMFQEIYWLKFLLVAHHM